MVHAHDPRKRKRESSSATEEQWRKLALTVPGTLMLIGTSEKTITDVDSFHGRLRQHFDRIRMVASGRKVSNVPAESGGSAIGSLIDAAVRETTCLKAHHAEAGHVFALCAAHLGLQGNALQQRLDDHRSDAVGVAKDALWWMCSVSSAMEVVNGILRVASRLRLLRPPPQEALQLLGRAVQEVAMARVGPGSGEQRTGEEERQPGFLSATSESRRDFLRASRSAPLGRLCVAGRDAREAGVGRSLWAWRGRARARVGRGGGLRRRRAQRGGSERGRGSERKRVDSRRRGLRWEGRSRWGREETARSRSGRGSHWSWQGLRDGCRSIADDRRGRSM